MNKYKKSLLLTISLILFAFITGCDTLLGNEDEGLQASGVVEAREVTVSPEIGGRVAEVLVTEGDRVEAGEILFRMESEMFEAQRQQAQAALEMAQAQLDTAHTALDAAHASLASVEAGVEIARHQHGLALLDARLMEQPGRIQAWDEDIPSEFSLPPWYFQKSERIRAAYNELESAQEALEVEEENFESITQEASRAVLQEVEERLLNAQTAFIIVEELIDRDVSAEGREDFADHLDTIFDAAEAELEDAQTAYDEMLTDQSAADVLEARVRLAIAQERYETALDLLNGLLTGEDAISVKAAEAAVKQAEASLDQAFANIAQAESGVVQAEKGVAQAQASLDLIDLQLNKLAVPAAITGLVMTRNIEPGELIQPGMVAFTLGQLDQMTVKVYVPENLYGEINIGDSAEVTVDSFPGQTFEAKVIRIADRAEFTPRNVQTQEERQTTVFEIELEVIDPDGKLKPGMPADVSFQ